MRAELSQQETFTMNALRSLENRARMLFAQTHNGIGHVRHMVSDCADTDPHTS